MPKMTTSLFSILLSFLVLCVLQNQASATNVTHDGRAIIINGHRRILLSGSIHYPRSTPEMWPDLIKKAKEGGLDAIETYVFWNAHEPVRRQYDFSGRNNLIKFIKTIHEAGLYAVLRIGPYVCAEWNYGGFPLWLHNMPNIELRTVNEVFMHEMKNFTTLIVDMMKKESLFASQGGPIILAQIENEYGNVMSSYGEAGKAYVKWCASMAVSQNIGVPWIMCQQSDAPQPMINTCNGWYCDNFTPNNPNSPKMWTENWTGWFKNWGAKDPYRTAEDLAFAVARFYQTGGTFQNYYMYHGGTNFGRTAGGPYITTSYDYDAPLDEYGNLNQPKWGHLKQLHEVLRSIEHPLVYGNVSNKDMNNSLHITTFTTNKRSSCFFGNANASSDATFTYKGTNYTVPAWSVSILPDCKNVAYNTAKVSAQTSIMEKRPIENKSNWLKWSWMPEKVANEIFHIRKPNFMHDKIIDQKKGNGSSDYLWYMTKLHLHKNDPIWSNNMTLKINATGQVLHTFVNGQHIGSKWATYGVTNYHLRQDVKLRPGKNLISILSATVGYQNYGPKYDMIPNGISGSIEIIGKKGDETIIKDLSSHKWAYKVGTHELNNKIYQDEGESSSWKTSDVPTNRMMTWYKTTFEPPSGNDPVVVDLQGLGKGMAWVNGYSLGRYWPSYLASEDGCSLEPCDYRGSYNNNKCVYNCGKPTQRFYHVPRSYFLDKNNTLILFEEFGGNPSYVNFRTVTVGKACVNAHKGSQVTLSCHGKAISAVEFASYGNIQGTCGAFAKGSCENSSVQKVIEDGCVGKESCSFEVSEKTFGSESTCDALVNQRLAVQVACSSW